MRIGLVGVDSSHAEDFLNLINVERRYPGHRVTAIHGTESGRAGALAAAFAVKAAAAPADLIGGVDAVIVGDRHGGLHLNHALPFLDAGLPAFIDKPLACSIVDAEHMLSAARRSGAMITSASAVRWQPDTAALEAEIQDLGGLREVTTTGPFDPSSVYGGSFFYGIHAVELALQLAGGDIQDVRIEQPCADCVEARGFIGNVAVAVRLRRPADGEEIGFGAEAVCARDTIRKSIGLAPDYMSHVVDRFIEMLETSRAPLPDAELLAPVRLMAAIDEAVRGAAG